MTVDLERQLKISSYITQNLLRPDIILVSEVTRQLILLELTVPWEERMEEAQEKKRTKYQEQVEDCHRNGWRRFASHRLSKAYGVLGIIGLQRKSAINNNVEAAEKAGHRKIYLKLFRPHKWFIAHEKHTI